MFLKPGPLTGVAIGYHPKCAVLRASNLLCSLSYNSPCIVAGTKTHSFGSGHAVKLGVFFTAKFIAYCS